MFVCTHVHWALSHLVMLYSLWPHGLQPTRLLYPWNCPGKNARVGCHFLLQGIFPLAKARMHQLDGLQIHIILYGLLLAGWPLIWISVDCLKRFPMWLFHSANLCQPLLSTGKIKAADFLHLASAALQKSFQLTSPSLLSQRTECPHCFQRPTFLFHLPPYFIPATPTMLLHPYPTSLASFISSKSFSSVLRLANILGAHLFPAPNLPVSWETPTSQNPVEVFYDISPNNPKLPFVKTTTNSMGCSLPHLVPNTSSSHPPS